eukprot:gene10968-12195_t
MTREYLLGLIFILLCAAIWAGASVLIQYIYEDLDFRSPFFLTYLATTLLSAHLPAYYGHRWYRENCNKKKGRGEGEGDDDDVVGGDEKGRDERSLLSDVSNHNSTHSHTSIGNPLHQPSIDFPAIEENTSSIPTASTTSSVRMTTWEVVKIGALIAPVWFGANCLYNYSLLMTSVSSSTIISNLSSSFTLFFAWYMGLEGVTWGKILGVIICFVGAVVVGLQDEDGSQQQTVVGDIVALLAAAGYGVYTTIIRFAVPNDEAVSMQLLLGYVGAANGLMLLPALIIMICVGWGNIASISGQAFGFIALNGFMDTVIADYFWARAVILTSPTVATIGMSITIPIALVTDYFINGISPTYISVLGSLSVIVGFILVNMTPEQEAEIVDMGKRTFFYLFYGIKEMDYPGSVKEGRKESGDDVLEKREIVGSSTSRIS